MLLELYQVINSLNRSKEEREVVPLAMKLARAVSSLRDGRFAGVEELEALLDEICEFVVLKWFGDGVAKDRIRLLMKVVSALYTDHYSEVLGELRRERESSEDKFRKGIVAAQENERRRVALMLHDSVLQSMAGVLVRVQMLADMLRGESHDVRRELVELEEIVRETITSCRLVAINRNLFLLEKAGFAPTVQSYVLDYQNKYGIQVTVDLDLESAELVSPEAGVHLFYIIREALTNIQKHAEASSARVVLKKRGTELVLVIEDDGKGFVLDEKIVSHIQTPSADHFGLYCMEQRVKLLRGRLKVESTPGCGTRLIVSVPVVGDFQSGREVLQDRGRSPWVK